MRIIITPCLEQSVYSQVPRNVYLNQVSQCLRSEEGYSLKKYCLAAGDFAQFMKDLLDQCVLTSDPPLIPKSYLKGAG